MVLSVLIIDLALAVGRLLTFTTIFAMPGTVMTIGWFSLSFAAAVIFVIWANSSKLISGDFRLPTAVGLLGGVLMVGHMALENFGARVGEDWRLTVTVMLAAFALWFGSGWYAGRKHFSAIAGASAGCWAAIVSVTLAIMCGFLGMYFNVPAPDYVATWPEYIQGGWSDPQAFAIANTIDSGTSHILTALFLGPVLGGTGGMIGALQIRGVSSQR
jgi:hypothetical protein